MTTLCRHSSFALLLAPVVFVGCGDDVPLPEETGTPVVEIASVSEVPVVDVTALDFQVDDGALEAPLHLIRDMVVDANGRIVVLSEAAPHLRWYDPDGTLHAYQGRSGDGPFEFRRPVGLMVEGDLLHVLDVDERKVVTYSGPGEPEESTTTAPIPSGDYYSIGVGGAGWLLAELGTSIPLPLLRAGGPGVDSMSLHVHPADSTATRQIVALPQMDVLVEGGSVELDRPRHSLAYAGGGDLVYVAPGDEAEIVSYTLSGEVARRVHLATAKVDEGEVERILLVDQQERLWTRGFMTDVDTATGDEWLVLSTSGRPLARARFPQRVQLVYASPEVMLGIHRDELGAVTIRVFDLSAFDSVVSE